MIDLPNYRSGAMKNSEKIKLSKDIKENIETLKQRLPIEKSFDVIGRELII